MDNQKKTDKEKSFVMKVLDVLGDITERDFLSVEFILSHIKTIMFAVLLIIVLISNRYKCQQQTRDIVRLKDELKDVKYESVTRSSELIDISRPSQVKILIEQQSIDIIEADKPAYVL